jgi:hypothetical protein
MYHDKLEELAARRRRWDDENCRRRDAVAVVGYGRGARRATGNSRTRSKDARPLDAPDVGPVWLAGQAVPWRDAQDASEDLTRTRSNRLAS